MRILIVEDDEITAKALETILSNQTYAVERASDGDAAWQLADAFDYDLILLDIVLPKLDGITLCRKLRSHGYTMPILLLTGRDSGHDKAIGLDAGGDDYVVKPFDPEELVARVRALLRRGGVAVSPILTWGALTLDPGACEVKYGDHQLQLTPKEYALLELLMRNQRRVFSCGMVLEHLWSYEDAPGEEAVRTHIKCVRQKLKAAGAPPDLIETVYGIGYRLKPSVAEAPSPETESKPVASQSGESTQQQTLSAIAGVWEQFKQRVATQVSLLEQAATALSQKKLDDALRQRAEQEAHSLAGALGTFGLPEGTQLAREIERLLQAETSLKSQQVKQLQQQVTALRKVINQHSPNGQPIGTPGSEPRLNQSTNPDRRPLLLVVDRDQPLIDLIKAEAEQWDIRVNAAATLSAARKSVQSDRPDIVLYDPAVTRKGQEDAALLKELASQSPPIPCLVFTTQDSLTSRLTAARMGGRAFLEKPQSPPLVLEVVNQVLQRIDPAEARILIVDDDPQILAALRALLEPWGLKVSTLADPRQFWKRLARFSPDLLILDVKMPHVNGVELCQVVRNDPHWGGLPVIFLTAHTGPEIINQVFSAGADDFVNKPIVGPELVVRILNRLERTKLLRRLADIDPLTGVSNRYKSTLDLESLLHLAKRANHPLCFAILDLEGFKEINNRYGHAVGDAVLSQLGQLLLQSLHPEDVVARWGGEEFIIGLYGMPQSEGSQQLTELLQTLQTKDYKTVGGKTLSLTFNAGVAQYPETGTDIRSLYQSAYRALQQAKADQQMCVYTAEATEPESSIR
ncbi:MAG: response regulator [Leptolyngbyaceae cyanobacterium MO_188.B28]|nr:response regulator [Leptolyngbyaceae cyanobacterium MO_188.B28]